jgi:hypothetical protein
MPEIRFTLFKFPFIVLERSFFYPRDILVQIDKNPVKILFVPDSILCRYRNKNWVGSQIAEVVLFEAASRVGFG